MKATRAVLGLVAAGALVMSACGDDNGDSNATTASTAAAPSTTAGAASTTAASGATTTSKATETTAPAKKAFDPSLKPIVVGFHNLEGGQYSIPETREGFEAGVEYVNTELGGINGHELQVDYCKVDITPESAINCANEFVEKGVVASVQGYDLFVDAALPILKEAGILEIVPAMNGSLVNTSQGDAINLSPSSQGGPMASTLVQAKNMGAKKIAYVLSDIPTMHNFYDTVVTPTSKTLGLETQVFYYTQPTDWTTFAPTVLTGGTDFVNMFGVDADFLAAIPAFRGAGFTGTLDMNTFAAFDKLDPAMLKDVIVVNQFYLDTMTSGVPAAAQKDIDVYLRYEPTMSNIKQVGPSRTGFYIAVMTANVLSQATDPTSAASVKEAGPKAKGHVFFTDQNYDCSKPTWPNTTSCTAINIYSSPNAQFKLDVLPNQPVDMSSALPKS